MKLKTIILLISSLSFSLSFADGVRVDLHGMGDLKLDFTPDGTYDSRNATKTILDKDTNGCISTYLPYGVASNCAGSDWVGGIMSGDVYSKQDKDGNNVNVKLMIKNRHASFMVNHAVYVAMSNRMNKGGRGYGYDNYKDDWHEYTSENDYNTKVTEFGFDAYTFGTLTIADLSDKDSDGKSKKYKCDIMLATFTPATKAHPWEIFFKDKNRCGDLFISLNKTLDTRRVIQISKMK